jgi:hypothetical protein
MVGRPAAGGGRRRRRRRPAAAGGGGLILGDRQAQGACSDYHGHEFSIPIRSSENLPERMILRMDRNLACPFLNLPESNFC